MDELDSVTVQPPDRASVAVRADNNQLTVDSMPHLKYREVLHSGRLAQVGTFAVWP